MPTLTLIIQAVDDADLSTRLSNISDQIKQGYGGAQGKTDAGVFKYLIKDTVKGSEAQLPRIPTTGAAQSEEGDETTAEPLTAAIAPDESEEEIDENDQDTAGVEPIVNPVLKAEKPFVANVAAPVPVAPVPTTAPALGHPLVNQALRNVGAGVGVALPTAPVAAQVA